MSPDFTFLAIILLLVVYILPEHLQAIKVSI
jgi:Ca2+/H+ antiporter